MAAPSIIDIAQDATPSLARFSAAGVKTIFGYLSSINPSGAKCWTPARVQAAAKAGFRIGLVHEGYGGVGGKGITAGDGVRDGSYCRARASVLGAPAGAAVYFACDADFSPSDIQNLIFPYFKAIRAAFVDKFYRVGVYGSGASCAAVIGAGLADVSWLAGSKGWAGYAAWLPKATMVQTVDANVAGVPSDSDVAQGDIGDFVPGTMLAPVPAAAKPSVKTVSVVDLYGLGGVTTSPGMLTLAQKIKALGKNFVVLGPYDQSVWTFAQTDIAARPSTDLTVLLGYSLGANNIVLIANGLRRKVDDLIGIQASVWGMGASFFAPVIALPDNVRASLSIYNPSYWETIGLGYARYGSPAQLMPTSDLHPAVDNDAGLHTIILNRIKALVQ